MTCRCFIGMGSNSLTPEKIFNAQKELMSLFPDIRFSELRHTLPVNFTSPNKFFNQVAVFTTSLSLDLLSTLLKDIERQNGRAFEDKARGIVKLDLDVLIYAGRILKADDMTREYIVQGLKDLEKSKNSEKEHTASRGEPPV